MSEKWNQKQTNSVESQQRAREREMWNGIASHFQHAHTGERQTRTAIALWACAWLNWTRRMERGYSTRRTHVLRTCAHCLQSNRSTFVVSLAVVVVFHHWRCIAAVRYVFNVLKWDSLIHTPSSTKKKYMNDGNITLSHRIIPSHVPSTFFSSALSCAFLWCQKQKTCKISTNWKTQTTIKWHAGVWLQTRSEKKKEKWDSLFVWRCA